MREHSVMSRLLCATACRRTRTLSCLFFTLLKTARHPPPPAQILTSTFFAVLCLRHWVFLGKLIPQNTSVLFRCRDQILQLTDVPASSQHLELWRPFNWSLIQFYPLLQAFFFIPLAKSSVPAEETFCLCRRTASISWRNGFDSIILESQHLIRQSFCQHLIRQSF